MFVLIVNFWCFYEVECCTFVTSQPWRASARKQGEKLCTYNLSGPVLRNTARLSQRYPPIARYGVFGVSTWPIGCDTPSPFSERFPLGEHGKWRCDTPPPPQKGYLIDTCTIPYENKAKWCDTPLCDTISRGYCAIWGGISHWGWAAKLTIGACLLTVKLICLQSLKA